MTNDTKNKKELLGTLFGRFVSRVLYAVIPRDCHLSGTPVTGSPQAAFSDVSGRYCVSTPNQRRCIG